MGMITKKNEQAIFVCMCNHQSYRCVCICMYDKHREKKKEIPEEKNEVIIKE